MRHFTTFIMILGASALQAAASGPLDSMVVRDADGAYLKKEAYLYDANGKEINKQTYSWTSGELDATSKMYENCYDEKGSNVLTTQYNYDVTNLAWKGYTKTENVYNAQHQLVAKVTYQWQVKYWVVKQSIEYTYYPNGKSLMTNTVNFSTSSAGAWTPASRNIKYKDTRNRDSVEIQFNSYKDNEWVRSYQKDYLYDAVGNKIQYDYWSSWSNGEWTADSREEWTYNAQKRETYYQKTTLTKGNWTNNAKRITAYFGTTANKTLYEEYTGSGTIWNCKTKQVTEYNASSRKTLYEVYTGKDTQWIKSTRELWEYLGTTANLTLHEQYTATNNEWIKKLKEVTVYNAQTRKVLYEKYNGSNNVWVGAQRDTTSYLGTTAKVLLEEHYVGVEADGSWKGKANGKTIYEYNNAAGSKVTLKEVYTWNNKQWVGVNRTVQNYEGNNTVLYEYYNSYTQSDEYTGWHGQQKYTQTYSSNLLSSRTDYKWNETAHEFVVDTKKEMTYTNSKKTEENAFKWEGDQWVPVSQDKWTYSGNNLMCEEHYTWDGTSWVGKSNGKTEYEYNSANKQIGTATYTWKDGAWEGIAKSTSTYVADGRIDSMLVYVWENSDWVLDQKTKGFYTTNEIKVVHWERVEGVLTYKAKGDTIYDTHGNNLLSGQYLWEDDHWAATALSKTDALYETIAGVERLMYLAIMDSTDERGWVGKSKMEYKYDEAGYKTFEQSSIWKEGIGWQWSWKHEWTYNDKHYTLKDIMHIWYTETETPYWMGASWSEYEYTNGSSPTTVTMYTYDNFIKKWTGKSKTQTIYGAGVTSSIEYAWKKDVPEEQCIPTTNGIWIGKTRTDVKKDSKGRTIETSAYGWCEDDWGLASMNATEYDQDAAGKVRSEVVATYACGETTSYQKTTYYYCSDPK